MEQNSNENVSKIAINLNDEEEDSDSIIEVTLISGNKYEFDYCQIFKYSQLIKNEYPFDRAKQELSQLFQRNQKEYEIDENSIYQFFLLIKEENVYLSTDNCLNLWKISVLFKVKKLGLLISKYIKINKNDPDFLSHFLLEQVSGKSGDLLDSLNLSIDIEKNLSDQIENCFKSKYFGKLPISVINQIIEMCEKKNVKSDSLYQFIKESIEERYILFIYIDLQSLSDENFKELATGFRENNSKSYYDYFKTDFTYLNSLREEKIELERRLENLLNENEQINSEKKELINLNEKIQSEKDKIQSEKEKIQSEKEQIQSEKEHIQSEKEHIKSEKEQIQSEKEQIQSEKNKFETQTNILTECSEKNYIRFQQNDKKYKQLNEVKKYNDELLVHIINGDWKKSTKYIDENGVYFLSFKIQFYI